MVKFGLPGISSKLPGDVRQFLDKVREVITGGSFVSRTDLEGAGIISSDSRGNIQNAAVGSLLPPPAPTGLLATGAMTSILVEWDDPTYGNHSVTEIWASGVNDLGQAVLVGTAPGVVFSHAVGAGQVRYYWVRFVSKADIAGPYNAVAGTQGATANDPAWVLSVLTGQITTSQLYTDLNTRINLIDAADTVAGSVAARVKAEADARIAAVSAEAQTRSDAVALEVSNRIAAVSAEATTRATAVSDEITARSNAIIQEVTDRNAADAVVLGTAQSYTATYAYNKATTDANIAATANTVRAEFAAADTTGYNNAVAYVQTYSYAKATVDSAVATVNNRLTSEIAGVNSTLTTDYYTKATIDSAQTSQTNTLTANYQAADTATLNSAQSYVQTYAYTKAATDSADAGVVTTLRTQFAGGYTGTDLSALTSGLLYDERVTRANADSSLSQQITLLSAGSGEQFDPFKIYYYDSGVESWTGQGTPTAADGWLRPANHATDPYVTSPDALAINGGTYPQVRLRLRKTGTPTWIGELRYITNADTTWNDTKKITISEPSYSSGMSVASWNMTGAWLTGTIKQIRIDLSTDQDASNYFELDWVAIGRPSPGASVAALLDEATARSSADSAEVTARQSLSSKITGANDPSSLTLGTLSSGLLYDEKSARSTADSTEVTARQSLSTKVTGAADPSSLTLATLSTGLIYDEKTARSTADSTEVTARQSLSAKITGQNDPTGLTLGTLASGLIYDEKTARVSAVSAQAGRIDSLEATVNNGTTGVVATANALDTVELAVNHASTGNTALGTRVTTIETTVNHATTGVVATANALDLVEAKVYSGTEGNTALASRTSTLESAVNNGTTGLATKASVSQVATAKAEAIAASATVTDSISARLNSGDFAAVATSASASASAITGLSAQYSLKIDNNGFLSGWGLASEAVNATPFSQFVFQADRFSIINPNTSPITVSSLTRAGAVVTATTGVAHGRTTGDYVVIAGANERDYNGTKQITVTGATTFTYAISTTPATPATGSIKMGHASVPFVVDGGKVVMDAVLIKDGAITNAKIGNLAVDNAKIASGLDAAKITVGYLSADRIAANSITAAMINSNGLSIKDTNGNIILAAGTPLTSTYITPAAGWLNSNVSIGANGTLSGAGGGTVTIGGLGYSGSLSATSGKSLALPLEEWVLNGQSIVTLTDGKVGQKALRIIGSVGAYANAKNYFRIDPTKTYRTRFWARPSVTNTSGTLYFCLRQFLDEGSTPGPSNGGRSPYQPAITAASHNAAYGAQAWNEYSNTWGAAQWQTGARFVLPEFLDNYSGAAGHWDIQDFTFEEVTEVTVAQSTANTAVSNAATAQSTANTASTNASTALSTLTDIASDSLLTPDEKPSIIAQRDVIVAEQAGIDAQATTYGITTEKTTYDTAVTALTTYLATLTSPVLWSTLTDKTTIVGATFRTKFNDVYAARQALLNKIADEAGKRAIWGTNLAGRPKFYRAVSTGYSSQTAPTGYGLYDETATLLTTAWRSYAVHVFDRATGVKDSTTYYDTLAGGTPVTNMAAALNALNSSKIVVIQTQDEPQSYRLTNGLDTAMYRCGASRAVFGSTASFKSRSAYVLIGVPNCGAGNGFEAYAGAVDSDPNAWVDVAFQIYNGNVIVTGAQRTNSSVKDFDYTGDLNATVGAPAGTYVGATLAQTVESNASTALTNAGTANTLLADIASDSKLTASEKQQTKVEWDGIVAEKPRFDTQADAFSITTEKTNFGTSYTTLSNYITPLLSSLTTTSDIVGATFRANFADYYDKRQLLLNKIATEAGTRATWATVTGTGKPADNATVGAIWGSNLTGKPADTDLLNTHLQGNVLVVNHPAGANYGSNVNNIAGAIKITLPQTWTNTMMRMFIEVYEYGNDLSFTVEVGGYNYASGPYWANCYAKMTGSAAAEKVVRFGHDGTKCCIWIGEPGYVWSYPQVTVSNFRAGFSNATSANWAAGWTVGLDATAHSGHAVTQTIANPLTGASWSQVAGTGKPADGATANVTTQGTFAARPTGANGDFYYATDTYTLYQKLGDAWVVTGDITAQKTAAAIASQGAFATLSQITGANISTYIAGASIGTAQIADASITSAKIVSLNADKVVATSLSAITATIGTLRTATTGSRTEIADNVIRVYDSNILRVKIGNLA